MSTSTDQPDRASETDRAAGLDPTQLIPELFGRFFEFFRPGHTEGIAPARIKELARLKVASINECDT